MRTVLLMVVRLVLLGSGIPAFSEPIIAFKSEPCFAAVAIQPRPGHPPTLGAGGLEYFCLQNIAGARLDSITVGVHTNVETCRAWLRAVSDISVGFIPDRCTYPLGDEGYLYQYHNDGGTIRFRRENLSVEVRWRGPFQDILPKLQQLDNLIQNNASIAVRGQFTQTPVIEALPIPRPLDREPVEVHPVVRGLGASDGLFVHMEAVRGEGQPIVIGAGNKWALRAKKVDHIPPVPVTITRPDGTRVTELKTVTVSPRGSVIIRIMAANRDHVFVTRDFEVPVAP